jgi:hypothetical protein
VILIADVAGQYEALMRLIAKMPKDELLFLGDLVDRGPDSDKVIEFAMQHKCIMGNHEHMMLDYCRKTGLYDGQIWQWNGGDATLDSYASRGDGSVPENVLKWIEGLPLFYEEDGLFASHAPADSERSPISLLWSRKEPVPLPGVFQVFGHNSHWGLKWFGEYAVCLDQSRKGVVTGMHWPSLKIFTEPYVAPNQVVARL